MCGPIGERHGRDVCSYKEGRLKAALKVLFSIQLINLIEK